MKKFRIYYGLADERNDEPQCIEEFIDFDGAMEFAWDQAYDLGVSSGIIKYKDCIRDWFADNDNGEEDQEYDVDDVNDMYTQAINEIVTYWAEEVKDDEDEEV